MQCEPATSVAVSDPVFADEERLALAGFLAGYRGATRDAYALDLRQFVAWCAERRLALFSVRRADTECDGRALEEGGRARPPSPCVFAPWPGSTAMRKRRGSWPSRRLFTYAGPAWTTNRTPLD